MRVNFYIAPAVPSERRGSNATYSRSLGYPHVQKFDGLHDRPLAVLGAGPSLAGCVEQLLSWPGDIWAVNGAGRWCRDNGIDFTFLTMCSVVQPLDFMRKGQRAIVASCCDPEIFAQLNGCNVELIEVEGEGAIPHFSTSISVACALGPITGYRHVTFFGCESSYPNGKTHVNEQQDITCLLEVRVGDEKFVTSPQMWIQAEALSKAIRMFPHVYAEQSDGLLRALVKSGGEYELVWASPEMQKHMIAA